MPHIQIWSPISGRMIPLAHAATPVLQRTLEEVVLKRKEVEPFLFQPPPLRVVSPPEEEAESFAEPSEPSDWEEFEGSDADDAD